MESARAPWNRNDSLIATALFVVTFLSRIPFRTTLLYAWDSVLYTRALDGFDVTASHPQPPGHIFYVWLIKLVNSAIGDPNAAMVWISIFFAAASVAMLYWLGRTMLGRGVGLAAAVLLATSLSFWVYSEIAYPYTLLAFLSTAMAALIYQTWQGKTGFVVPTALLLGLAAGFRQDLLPFLLPLLVVGWIGKPVSRVAAAIGLMAAAALTWYVPAALLSGGFAAYQNASSEQSSYLIHYSSVLGTGLTAVKANLDAFSRFLGWGLAAAIPAMAVFAISIPFPWFRSLRGDRRLWFLAVWAVPSILFYIFIHIGEYGYVFSFLPAALLAAAWGASQIASSIGRGRGGAFSTGLLAVFIAPLVCVNLFLFLFSGPPMSAERLAARDGLLRSKIDTIKSNFDPASTIIVSVFDEQEVDYYLPGYRHFGLDPMEENHVTVDLGSATRVVIFEEYLHPAGGSEGGLPLVYNQTLKYLDRRPGQTRVSLDWDSKGVALEGD